MCICIKKHFKDGGGQLMHSCNLVLNDAAWHEGALMQQYRFKVLDLPIMLGCFMRCLPAVDDLLSEKPAVEGASRPNLYQQSLEMTQAAVWQVSPRCCCRQQYAVCGSPVALLSWLSHLRVSGRYQAKGPGSGLDRLCLWAGLTLFSMLVGRPHTRQHFA